MRQFAQASDPDRGADPCDIWVGLPCQVAKPESEKRFAKLPNAPSAVEHRTGHIRSNRQRDHDDRGQQQAQQDKPRREIAYAFERRAQTIATESDDPDGRIIGDPGVSVQLIPRKMRIVEGEGMS